MTEKEVLEHIDEFLKSGNEIMKYFAPECERIRGIRWDIDNLNNEKKKIFQETEQMKIDASEFVKQAQLDKQSILESAKNKELQTREKYVEAIKLLDSVKKFLNEVEERRYKELRKEIKEKDLKDSKDLKDNKEAVAA